MCIINMTGKTEKYINIHITKSSLMKKMIFSDEKEKQHCSKYLDLKGVAYHVILINLIGLDNDGRIKYKLISDIYKYDKKIRNRLYKFLSAFEEQIRAFIANSFNHGLSTLQLGDSINKNLKSGSNIAFELEDLDFGQLLKIVEKFTKKDLKRMFPKSDDYVIDNLKAIKELRNAISHHRILLLYDEFEKCYIDGIEKTDLISNIKNLVNLIDEYYKQFLIDTINDATNDKRDSTFLIPERFIVSL